MGEDVLRIWGSEEGAPRMASAIDGKACFLCGPKRSVLSVSRVGRFFGDLFRILISPTSNLHLCGFVTSPPAAQTPNR